MKINLSPPLFIALIGIAPLVSSCNEDEPDQVALPSNLKVEITQDEEGLVMVDASATGANFYTTQYFESSDPVTVESNDGVSEHQFTTGGSFLVRTRAHATYDDFISQDDSITIEAPDDGSIIDEGYSTPISYPNYNLVWNDEFDGTTLSADWTHEIGTGSNGWGNNELQYYREQNTEVRDGYVIINALKEPVGGRQYTSSRIITENKAEFKYGRIDVRAMLPEGQGLWPAIWMLGSDFRTSGWPKCGEIDIMEMVGGSGTNRGDNVVHGTVHWDNNGQHAEYGGSRKLSSGKFSDKFHVFSIIWDDQKIEWYLDDSRFHTIDITPAELSEFQQEFFFIMNVAVGGNWPGSPNATTSFPQRMVVDYIRVFQEI